MTILKNNIIKGLHQKPILADVFYQKNNQKKPIVIFAHGFKGYKDWGAWNLVAEKFAENGFIFVKFNFSHNGGTVSQPIDFPDLEAFGNNNFIKELDDLQSVINWIAQNDSLTDEIDPENLTLIGHSRGGGIVLLKAAEEKLVKKVITWAAVADFGARFPKGSELENWRKKGVAYIHNSRTNQQMPLYFQFYQNFSKNKLRLNICNAVKRLKIPQLIIHGKSDETVNPIEAKNLHKWNPKSKLYFIEGNHTFGSKHPWLGTELPRGLEESVKKSIEFIAQN